MARTFQVQAIQEAPELCVCALAFFILFHIIIIIIIAIQLYP